MVADVWREVVQFVLGDIRRVGDNEVNPAGEVGGQRFEEVTVEHRDVQPSRPCVRTCHINGVFRQIDGVDRR